MSDFLTRLSSEPSPEAREVTVSGETGTVYFRRITAGEREQLMKGLKIAHTVGAGGVIDIDLEANERQRQMLVMFSVCDEQGRRFFKTLDAVRKLPANRVSVLAKYAEEVNAEDEGAAGKA